jgi:hypothetical protein
MEQRVVIDSHYWADIWDNHIKNGNVNIPCFHPAVLIMHNRPSGLIDPDVTRDMFINVAACCGNPSNLDAAVAFRVNFHKFTSTNERLRREYDGGECPVCLESFVDTDSFVYTCHLFHTHCVASLDRCPVCRSFYSWKAYIRENPSPC